MSLPPSRNDLVEAQRLRKADNLSNKLLALASKDLYLSQKRMKRGQEEEKGTGIIGRKGDRHYLLSKYSERKKRGQALSAQQVFSDA